MKSKIISTLPLVKNYCVIDLVKFICAFLVVILHVATYAFANMAVDGAPPTGASGGPLILYVLPLAYTILRIAVPFFFITSAFFLFKKLKENPEEKKEILKNYCIRLFKLWLFWFILSLPYVIDKFIFNSGLIWYKGLGLMLLNIVFRGGFDGAWFLLGLLVSVLLISWISKKYGNKVIFIVSLFFYVLAILDSSYFGIFKGTFLETGLKFINKVMPFYNSFMAGMVYVSIGKIFAEKEQLISKKLNNILLICSVPLMYGELLLINWLGLSIASDCFFFLIPFSIFFMQFLLNVQLKPRRIYIKMRKSSTFIYLSHFVFLYVLYRLVYAFNWTIFTTSIPVIIGTYFAIIGLAIGFCALIIWLSKKKHLTWLKYAL